MDKSFTFFVCLSKLQTVTVICEEFQITEGEKYDVFRACLKFHSFMFTENTHPRAHGQEEVCQRRSS